METKQVKNSDTLKVIQMVKADKVLLSEATYLARLNDDGKQLTDYLFKVLPDWYAANKVTSNERVNRYSVDWSEVRKAFKDVK